ncbi:unnamed protein product [Citrullus colocynthis]|uniref:EGF-like domain-containing protein n=1 Tax=Citrullus colocynthis TaxID=252529 RepID=A0ABP0XQL0_9ROSI
MWVALRSHSAGNVMEEGFSLCILISFPFFLATSGILNSSSSSQGTAACAVINCGQGTCKASNASFLGFDCECNSGWRKPQIGLFTFPYCVLPNGTSEFRSGGGSPPPPLLPPTTVVPFLHTPFEFSNCMLLSKLQLDSSSVILNSLISYLLVKEELSF